jgi:hypothetical protein
MLAILAFLAFVIAAILKLVGKDAGAIQWLIIIGGLLVSAAVAWGWGRPWWNGRTGPGGTAA